MSWVDYKIDVSSTCARSRIPRVRKNTILRFPISCEFDKLQKRVSWSRKFDSGCLLHCYSRYHWKHELVSKLGKKVIKKPLLILIRAINHVGHWTFSNHATLMDKWKYICSLCKISTLLLLLGCAGLGRIRLPGTADAQMLVSVTQCTSIA